MSAAGGAPNALRYSPLKSDLAETITDPATKELMNKFREVSIKPDAIARAIAFAVEQPADVDVSEVIVRPTASAF